MNIELRNLIRKTNDFLEEVKGKTDADTYVLLTILLGMRIEKILKIGERQMNYIKAKFPNSKRSYTYRTADEVKAGDIVVTDKGAKLTVTDETVDMTWVETYGAENVAVVKKYEEPVKAESEE